MVFYIVSFQVINNNYLKLSLIRNNTTTNESYKIDDKLKILKKELNN